MTITAEDIERALAAAGSPAARREQVERYTSKDYYPDIKVVLLTPELKRELFRIGIAHPKIIKGFLTFHKQYDYHTRHRYQERLRGGKFSDDLRYIISDEYALALHQVLYPEDKRFEEVLYGDSRS